MTGSKAKLNLKHDLKEDFLKYDDLEMVIIPKNQFLEWFKHMKSVIEEKDIKINKDVDWIECPNCQFRTENYTINNDPEELGYLCPKCNLKFSQRQHQYFTKMLMRLIQGNFQP